MTENETLGLTEKRVSERMRKQKTKKGGKGKTCKHTHIRTHIHPNINKSRKDTKKQQEKKLM